MKKMKVVSLFLIVFFSFFAFLDGVKAAVTNHDYNDRCNIGVTIGKNGEKNYSGYGNVRISSNVESPKGYGKMGVFRIDPKSNEWRQKVHTQIYVNTKDSNKKITSYEIVLYHEKDKANGEKKDYPLCTLSNKNTANLTGDESFILFDFDLTEGHVKKAYVHFTYGSGSNVDSKDKYIDIKKSLNGEGVYPTITENKSTTKSQTTKAKATYGYYMCNTAGAPEAADKQECVKKSTNASLANCEPAPFDKKEDCEKALKTTTITRTFTNATTTVTSDLPDLTHDMGGGDINKASKYSLDTKNMSYGMDENNRTTCEDLSVKDLIDEYWSIVMVLVPIALILLMSIDFIKALTANDQEQLKKSGNSAIKRTIAAVILLMLPALLSMILGWVGLELCI